MAIAENGDECCRNLKKWSLTLRHIAGQLYDDFGNAFCRTSEQLFKKEAGKKSFYGELKKNAKWSEAK